MRASLVVCLVVAVSAAAGADEPSVLKIGVAKSGDVGIFPQEVMPARPRPFYDFHVASILDKQSFIARVDEYDWQLGTRFVGNTEGVGSPTPWLKKRRFIIVKGMETTGLAHGEYVPLAGKFQLTGTQKADTSEGMKTLFVFERVPKDR
jgi:hypothetical protein